MRAFAVTNSLLYYILSSAREAELSLSLRSSYENKRSQEREKERASRSLAARAAVYYFVSNARAKVASLTRPIS